MNRRNVLGLIVACVPVSLYSLSAKANELRNGSRLPTPAGIIPSVIRGLRKRRCRLTLVVDDKLSSDKEGGAWHPMFIDHWSKKLVRDFADETLNVECVQCHKTNSRSYQLIIDVQEREQ